MSRRVRGCLRGLSTGTVFDCWFRYLTHQSPSFSKEALGHPMTGISPVRTSLASQSRFEAALARLSPHSQITITRQPSAVNFSRLFKSRARFAANFDCQKSDRVVGLAESRQPGCLCQKQPLTNTQVRYFGKTMSGEPGSLRSFSTYLRPARCSTFRTMISGLVSLRPIPAIQRARVSLSTMSVIEHF